MKSNFRLLKALLLLPLMLISLAGFSQKIKASGEIKSESGEPLIGVTVVEQGTTNGTISDLDGKFAVEVSEGAKLVFSFIGFESIELPAGSNMKVTMSEDTKAIEEVVVVGYGVQRKEAVTGSVASMKGDDMRAVQGSNITQSLQGRIAGVEMSQTSSKPGETMQIRIRGTRSLNASNDPLIVLDGIPFAGSLSDINPGDIKTLDILKDASATAIYGSRGANGVIIITTNRGTEGQKARISYNGYYGVKTLFSKFPMMDGEKFAKLRADRGQFKNGLDEADGNNVDWQDEYFDKGMVTSHDVSMTGGTAKGNYSFGMGYYKEESVSPNEDFSRFSLRGSVDQKIGDYFKVGFSTTNNFSMTNSCNKIFDILAASPIITKDENPSKIYNIGSSTGLILVPTADYVNSLGDKYADQRNSYGSYNTGYFEAELPYVKGLKYRVNVGLNFRNQMSGSYKGVGVWSTNPDDPSNASQTHAYTQNWAVENLITYDKIFAEKHSLNFVAMYSAESNLYNSTNISVRDIQDDMFQFWNLGRINGTITVNPDYQSYSKTGLLSYMARAMYSYDSKYMISATIRSDGSSRLAEGHKWHTYPAVSLGWNVKNESFMDGVNWMDQLKIRAGYGQTSNQSVDPYKTFGRLATQPYNYGPTGYATGYYISELPNAELGWEYSSTINVGLDMAFFKNRLNVTAEYYAMTTKDVLCPVSMPSTSGVGSYMANIGETQNKGFELNIDGTILNKNGWNWTAGVNMYINRNKLTKLASGQTEDRGNSWFVGYPIDCIYDFEYDGIWQQGEEELMGKLEPGAKPGTVKVKYHGEYDENGMPKRAINDDDKTPQSMEAKLQGGFNTTVTWKNIDFSIVGAFKCGGTLISTLYGSGSYLNLLTTKNNNVDVDYWTPENTGARFPSPTSLDASDNRKYMSTLGYFNASYLKLRTITLGYSFDGLQALKKAGISKCRVYATVNNPLVMFSDYKKESGMDPETNSYGDQNQAVASYSKRLLTIGTNTPATRTFMFGVNFTF